MTQLDRRDYAQLVAGTFGESESGDRFIRKSQAHDNPPGLSAGIWIESYQAALTAGGQQCLSIRGWMDLLRCRSEARGKAALAASGVLKHSTSSPRRSPSSPIGVRLVCGFPS
jgi:hypothetical protein